MQQRSSRQHFQYGTTRRREAEIIAATMTE